MRMKMEDNKSSNDSGEAMEAFLEAFYDNADDPAKVWSVAAGATLSVAYCGLLRIMISIERNSPENQRTIIARLTSTVFKCCLWRYALFFFPRFIQTLTGPWPEALCMLAMFADVLLFSATMTYAATIAILKAFFLVYFKNVWALKDDFWILFFKVWIGFMGAYSLVPLVTLPGEYPTYFVICIGGGQSDWNLPVRPNMLFSRLWLQTCSALAFFLMMTFVAVYRFVYKNAALGSNHSHHNHQGWKFRPNTVLANVILALATFAVVYYYTAKVNKKNFVELGPSFVAAFLAMGHLAFHVLAVTLFLMHHRRMREQVWTRLRRGLRLQF